MSAARTSTRSTLIVLFPSVYDVHVIPILKHATRSPNWKTRSKKRLNYQMDLSFLMPMGMGCEKKRKEKKKTLYQRLCQGWGGFDAHFKILSEIVLQPYGFIEIY